MKPEEHWAKWLPEDPRQPRKSDGEVEAEIVGALEAWAQQPEPHEPFDAGALLRRERHASRLQGLRLPLSLAAAALFLLALNQTQFSVQAAGVNFSWGAIPAEPASDNLAAAVAENKATAEQLAQQVQALSERDEALATEFRQAAATLLENQQVEALARYNDVQQLMQLSQGGAYQYQAY